MLHNVRGIFVDIIISGNPSIVYLTAATAAGCAVTASGGAALLQ